MRRLPLALAPLALAAAAALPGPSVRADFAPGEETVFTVKYLSLPAGEGKILVGEPAGDVWPIIVQARTDGFAALVDIKEHLVTYWDSLTHLTRGSDLRAYEVGDYHQDSARFDRVNGEATVTVQRKGTLTRKTVPIPAGAQDLTSAFLWVRLQPLLPGQRYELPVTTGERHFTLVAEVLGREPLEVPAGKFDTVKVKVRTELDGKFSTKRDSFLWLSDDPRHVLVRASADFAVGSVVASLKSYRPGARVAAR